MMSTYEWHNGLIYDDRPYVLSIEPTNGAVFQHGFHLGTDLRLARQIAEEKFYARNSNGMPTRTVAILRGGKMVDCYDGQWGEGR